MKLTKDVVLSTPFYVIGGKINGETAVPIPETRNEDLAVAEHLLGLPNVEVGNTFLKRSKEYSST